MTKETEQVEVTLKPCPGCGKCSTRVIGGPGTAGGPKYWAGCDYCSWRTWGETEAEAINIWNTRHRQNTRPAGELVEAALFKAIAHVHAKGRGAALPSAVDLMDPVAQGDLDRLHQYAGDIAASLAALSATPTGQSASPNGLVEALVKVRAECDMDGEERPHGGPCSCGECNFHRLAATVFDIANTALESPTPADGLREVLEPVMHWYQSDEHPERPLLDIVADVVADLQQDRAFALNPPKHKFWMPGEADCPHEIKAGNGELHTLRCKVCGQDNPRDAICRAGTPNTPTDGQSASPSGLVAGCHVPNLIDNLRETAIGCDHSNEAGLVDLCNCAANVIEALTASSTPADEAPERAAAGEEVELAAQRIYDASRPGCPLDFGFCETLAKAALHPNTERGRTPAEAPTAGLDSEVRAVLGEAIIEELRGCVSRPEALAGQILARIDTLLGSADNAG